MHMHISKAGKYKTTIQIENNSIIGDKTATESVGNNTVLNNKSAVFKAVFCIYIRVFEYCVQHTVLHYIHFFKYTIIRDLCQYIKYSKKICSG